MRSSNFLLITFIALAPLAALSKTDETKDLANIVHKFIRAFNAQDVNAMSALVTDDIRWNYINGSSVSAELEGKQALATSMSEYFVSCPSCRSAIHGMTCSAERVSVVEVASWDGRDGTVSQASMAVYEFEGPLIRAVYYFPEETEHSDQVFEGTCND